MGKVKPVAESPHPTMNPKRHDVTNRISATLKLFLQAAILSTFLPYYIYSGPTKTDSDLRWCL